MLLPHENPWLLQNARHRTSGCFAPIMHGFAHRVRTAYGIEEPRSPSPPQRQQQRQTWCWMFRSEELTQRGKRPGARKSAEP